MKRLCFSPRGQGGALAAGVFSSSHGFSFLCVLFFCVFCCLACFVILACFFFCAFWLLCACCLLVITFSFFSNEVFLMPVFILLDRWQWKRDVPKLSPNYSKSNRLKIRSYRRYGEHGKKVFVFLGLLVHAAVRGGTCAFRLKIVNTLIKNSSRDDRPSIST